MSAADEEPLAEVIPLALSDPLEDPLETKVTDPSPEAGTALEAVDDGAGLDLTTREGPHRFTAQSPTPPELVSSDAHAALSDLD
ncbi:hypothetical protein ACWGHA_36050 [Streptomyces xanthophaeus]